MRITQKKRLGSLIHWTLPPGIETFFRSNIRHFLPRHLKSKLRENEKYKNIHSGKRCFILGTGPSIATQNLLPLADEICFSVSQFYQHPDAVKIRPLYHVESPVHPPFGIEYVQSFYETLRRAYVHDFQLFLGHTLYSNSFYSYFNSSEFAEVKNINYVNYAGASQLDERNHLNAGLWDLTRTLFTARSVIYAAIQLASYMGFKEIYLLGCDHDYLKRYFDRTLDEHHFYKEQTGVAAGTQQYIDQFDLETWFEEYAFRWKQYRLMSEYLSARGQRIYNATEGGMLDVFPRVRLYDVVKT